jgi:hypothetical protein
VSIKPSFKADTQLAEADKPALDNPSMPAQSLAAFNPDTGNARCDSSALQIVPASAAVVSFVRMQFVGSLARPTIQSANRRDGPPRWPRMPSNRAGLPRDRDSQRNTLGVYDRCRLLPNLSRSVRFGPVSWPPRGWDFDEPCQAGFSWILHKFSATRSTHKGPC